MRRFLLAGATTICRSGSPCINAGTNGYVGTVADMDGNLRIAGGTVDMGAYEYQPPGALTVSLQASLTNVPVGYPVSFSTVFSKGQSNSWNFGDGTGTNNSLSATHIWPNPGDYQVTLTVYDSVTPGGVSASVTIHVKSRIVYYVSAAGFKVLLHHLFETWGYGGDEHSGCHRCRAAGAAIPRVSFQRNLCNGRAHCRRFPLTNRVMIAKTISVHSLNGASLTMIQGNPVVGDSAVRCAYVTNGANLSGFTLMNGATRNAGDPTSEQSGGGIWCESSGVISNCVISGNSAIVDGGGIHGGYCWNSRISSNNVAPLAGSGNGGGAESASLNNCTLTNNIAGANGGGADNCSLTNCVLLDNQASYGGGASSSQVINSYFSATGRNLLLGKRARKL